MGHELNEAHKDGSYCIQGTEGLLLRVILSPDRPCLFRSLCLVQQYMVEMVEARKNGDKVEQRHDLFSGFLDAALDEQDNEAVLDNEELIGGYPTS